MSLIQFIRERNLKRGFRAGEPEVVEMLFETYGERLYLYSLSLLHKVEDAEEALQNVFLKIARNPPLVSNAKNLKAYLYTAVRNESFDIRKKVAVELPIDKANIFEIDRNHEDRLSLAKLLDELPHEQREVLFPKIYQQFSFREIGAHLGISMNTAASRYRYAIGNLKGKMVRTK
jgi:RNA polymerase sigma-70 factor (ECF subfamily)